MQERQRFEEEWRSALEGAEAAPRDHIWSNIEKDLAGDSMKRSVVFYQRLAAGLLILSASLGALVWRGYQKEEKLAVKTESVSSEKNANEAQQPAPKTATQKPNSLASTALEKNTTVRRGNNQEPAQRASVGLAANTSAGFTADTTSALAVDQPQSTEGILIPDNALIADNAHQLPSDSTSKVVAVNQMTEEEALKVLQEYVNPAEEPKEAKKALREALWLGMGGATGSYNPNITSGAGDSYRSSQLVGAGASDLTGRTNRHEIGNAYSMGLSVGTRLSSRWIVQSGINYVNQRIDYTSNVVAFTQSNQSKMVIPEYYNATANIGGLNSSDPATEFASVTTTDTYTINNALELISIPMQAGFMIIDRRIGWQVNSGISSDIFVRNTMVDESGRVERFQQNAGKDSPYRSVNWTGLLSTELSYQLGTHYRLALVPGMRYYITSILKDQTSIPLILDLGFRFKYIVK